ncbi:M1 family metallopeptidase [Candidatus Saccharibacteria bacterium]|nr:M1 family metallopeptidase [Candidatus Saccharibacteria bacterium]
MKKVKRLYSEFKPERYELYLEPNREKATFSGTVKIIGRKTGRPSSRLTFHQKGLKTESAQIKRIDKKTGDTKLELDRHNTQNSYDELRLHSKVVLYPGKYEIELQFSGKITEPMHGIYPCNFEIDGIKKQLIATQFESHHAREVFPCIDEPEAKAVFSLSLKTPANEVVISNTPVKSERADKAYKISLFEDTPIMSSYLLAFVYGELAYKEAETKNGVKVRIYSTPDKIDLTKFGLDVSVRSLEFFEDYFGVPYPLSKLDVIGLPDFAAGAMENWGLITFREQVLYVDPKSSGIDTKQYVAMVVAHEVAHQWFGNLVTMRWWNDIWLNESFANLMEYRAVDELFPEWRIWEEFTAREMGSALTRDALPTVQALRTEVNHPDELSSLFDPSIVYAKGGSLLNMVRNLVGEPAFRAGLKSYFKEFAYQNTEAGDLWHHLARASDFDIEAVMKSWLQYPGYPRIDIEYDPSGETFSASQSRITIGNLHTNDNHTTWQVPLAASWSLDKPMLAKKHDTFKLTPQTDYPFVLNNNAHSYFVSHYANPNHLESILEAAKANTLNPIDRLLLVQSYLLLERAGKVPTTDNLHLLQSFSREREEAVWSMLAAIIGGVRTLLGKDEVLEDKFSDILLPLVKPLLSEIGWDGSGNDTAHTQKLRSTAVGLAASAKDPETIKEGLARFAKFSKPSDIHSDIRSVVYFIAVRHGTTDDFNQLLSVYKDIGSAEDKEEISSALSAVKQPTRIKQIIEMLTTSDIRLQDTPTWFARLMLNRYTSEYAWEWLKDNWSWVEDKYGNDKTYDRFPRYSAMAFSHPEQLAEFKKFFEPKNNIALERSIKLGIEEIEGRIIWRKANEQAVKDWINQAQ